MLVRGTFMHQYPYGFVNVWRLGYAQVAINIVVILIGSLLSWRSSRARIG